MHDCCGPVKFITDRITDNYFVPRYLVRKMASDLDLEPPSGGRVPSDGTAGLFRNQISCSQPLFDKVKTCIAR